MSVLEHFLRYGQLGPLILGMTKNEVIDQLGPPDDISRKSNPLVLRYGNIALTFWRPSSSDRQSLHEIVLNFGGESARMPPSVPGIAIESPPSYQWFRVYLREIGIDDYDEIETNQGRLELQLPSGLTAYFRDGTLESLRSRRREIAKLPSAQLASESVATVDDARSMLVEAEATLRAGAQRASLLIAWAGVEPLLRRLAYLIGREGKVGIQSAALLRDLRAAKQLTDSEYTMLERIRVLRSAVAHGTGNQSISPDTVRTLLQLGRELANKIASIPAQGLEGAVTAVPVPELDRDMVRAAREAVDMFSVTLVVSDGTPENASPCSGVLATINGRSGLLTATHNYVRMRQQSALSILTGRSSVLEIPASYLSAYIAGSNPVGDFDGVATPDICFIPLANQHISTLEAKGKAFYSVDRRISQPSFEYASDDGFWLVVGSLSSLFDGKARKVGRLSFLTDLSERKVIDGWDFLWINLDLEANSALGTDMSGMSGGGVWRIKFRVRPDGSHVIEDSTRDIVLSGIVFMQTSSSYRRLVAHGPESIYLRMPELLQKALPS